MAKAAEPVKKNEDEFTLREMIDYETVFKEPLSEITNGEKPRMKKIAYLAFLKQRRLDKNLTFDKYLDGDPSSDEAVTQAFGERKEDEETTEDG